MSTLNKNKKIEKKTVNKKARLESKPRKEFTCLKGGACSCKNITKAVSCSNAQL